MAREYQEHDAAVDGNSLFVQYNDEDGASGGVAKYVRLDEVVYPDGNRTVDYDYGTTQAIDDIMSRLASTGDGTDNYASYKYLGAGRIVEEDYEDIEVKLSYLDGSGNITGLDRFGRVTDQIWTDYGADPDVVLDRYTYTYDRAGNRTSRDNELHSAFDEDYTYDGLNRLTDNDRADAFDQSWGLDGLGNFSSFDDDGDSQTRTANAVNEITGITGGWITPSYDDAGNMTSGPKTGDETTRVHHVYDAWNRQTGVYEDDGDGTFEPGTDDDLVATYEYDGTNRRVEKTFADDSGVEYFYNHDWQMLEERAVDDEGTPTGINEYVWSTRYIDAPVLRFHDANADGDLSDAGDNTRYYTGDANYNVTATIDAATGEVVDRYVYTAYGQATVCDEDWANPAAPMTDGPLYAGYFFDAESGLYQVRNRYYDSSLSLFINRDPVEYRAGLNLYEYVGDHPVIYVDPSGLEAPPFPPTLGDPHLPPPSPPPPPAPTPGKGGHAKRPGGGYLWTCTCSSKKDRLSPIPGVVTPPKNPIPGTGPGGGSYQIYPFPSTPPAAVGGAGALPCNILVVKCPGFVGVFHFSVGDSPSSTLGKFSWPSGCSAIICGGDDSGQSNCLGDDVKSAAKTAGLSVVGVSGNSGCGVDANGNWYQYGN